MFEPTSRYYNRETATLTTPDGRVVSYVRRRFLPDVSGDVTLAEYTVEQGDRLDNITAHFLSDPEQFWRICDANVVLHPAELTAAAGQRLRITYPQA